MKASELIAHLKLITEREGDIELYSYKCDGSLGPVSYPAMKHLATKKRIAEKLKYWESGCNRRILKTVIHIP